MHLLMINGSPKGKGNTYKTAKRLEAAMKKRDSSIEFEYLHLKDANLKGCLGCYRCLADGEEKCPLKDDQAIIEAAMQAADAVIFSTPVYVANVSWMFKNFLDRFAYICHRPRFHGKKALVLSTTGSIGTGIVNIITKISVETWGFETVTSLGAIISPKISKEDEAEQWSKIEKDIEKAAERFVKELNSKKPRKAKFLELYKFKLQKASFSGAGRFCADYNYWKTKGWLEKECKFYMDAKVNLITEFVVGLLAAIKIRSYPDGVVKRSK